MELPNRLLIRVTGISSAATGSPSGHHAQVATDDDEFFHVNPAGRFVIGGPDGDAREKSAPETLTTACHAAS